MHQRWMDQLDELIQRKHMLCHPFYQAWTHGTLKKSTLQTYAKEYYQHVKAFPTYLSALHSRCDDPQTRRLLLANLMDEEAGDPNHLDLWRSFALALDMGEEEVDTHGAQSGAQELVSHFRKSCREEPFAVGLAALYCYESQIPSICRTKIEGLERWYGFTNPEQYRYFSVHETADVEHARVEKEALRSCVQPGEEEAVLEGAERTLDALGNFLSSFPL